MSSNMDATRWRQVQELFTAALAEGAEDPTAFVRASTEDQALQDEVVSLLAAHGQAQETTFLDPLVPAAGVTNSDLDGLPQIDRYHWLGRLGQGGMGSVYLAVRADDSYQQTVAIKLLRRDLGVDGLVRRFERERQILAELEHPNIARLLDGGTASDGRPYLIMEHVAGWPIDAYCRQHGLGISQRLALVVKVCAAVHAAHQRLIVHRDLKPANILVTPEGEPKLLDFGIAKLLDGAGLPLTSLVTASGLTPMTPEYASPEQLRGQSVTTASDLYALGVLLYELLTGRRPLPTQGLPADRALLRLLEDIPRRPSEAVLTETGGRDPKESVIDPPWGPPRSKLRRRWSRRLGGDLDAILLTALAKEPERRYASAEALSGDLERYLGGLPVTARGNSMPYLVGRFVRRHWLPVALALFAVLGQTGLMIGLALERAEAARQRDRATVIAETLVEIFEDADPGHAQGETLTARSVLESGRARIEALASQPELQAELQATMGRVYTSLGLLPPAQELLRQSLASRRQLHRGDHVEVAVTLELLGQALHSDDQVVEAESLLQEAVAMRRRLHGDPAPEVAQALGLLASVLHREGRFEEARERYQEAVQIRRRDGQPGPLGRTLNALGTLQRDLGDYAQAAELHRQAITELERADIDDAEPELAWALANLGTALRRQGDYDAAEAAYLRAERLQRKLYVEPHPLLAYTLDQLGLLRLAQDRLDEAERLLTEALAQRRVVFAGSDARIVDTLSNLAKVQLEQGDLDSAEEGFTDALELLRTVLPAGHKDLAAAINYRAEILARRGDLDGAVSLFEEALTIQRQHFGNRHRSVAMVLSNLARSLGARGEHRRAIALREEAVDILRQHLGDEHPEVAALLYNLGVSYHRAGDVETAAERYREALAIAEPVLGDEHGLVRALHKVLKPLGG